MSPSVCDFDFPWGLISRLTERKNAKEFNYAHSSLYKFLFLSFAFNLLFNKLKL